MSLAVRAAVHKCKALSVKSAVRIILGSPATLTYLALAQKRGLLQPLQRPSPGHANTLRTSINPCDMYHHDAQAPFCHVCYQCLSKAWRHTCQPSRC